MPTVAGSIVGDMDEAKALAIPAVGAGRTGIYVDAIRRAAEEITDRPVFAGVIGPLTAATMPLPLLFWKAPRCQACLFYRCMLKIYCVKKIFLNRVVLFNSPTFHKKITLRT